MLQIHYFLSSPLPEATPPPLSTNASDQPNRKRLRLYLVGSKADAQHTIDHLHVRGCIERIEWSHEIEVPDSGILIRRDPGDVLRYLQRYRRFD